MTENEAIELLKNNYPKTRKMVDGRLQGGFDDHECDVGIVIDLAIKALEEIQQYRTIGTVEECWAAVEKQTAIPRELIEGKYFCQKCHNLMPYPGYCGCGQKVY